MAWIKGRIYISFPLLAVCCLYLLLSGQSGFLKVSWILLKSLKHETSRPLHSRDCHEAVLYVVISHHCTQPEALYFTDLGCGTETDQEQSCDFSRTNLW